MSAFPPSSASLTLITAASFKSSREVSGEASGPVLYLGRKQLVHLSRSEIRGCSSGLWCSTAFEVRSLNLGKKSILHHSQVRWKSTCARTPQGARFNGVKVSPLMSWHQPENSRLECVYVKEEDELMCSCNCPTSKESPNIAPLQQAPNHPAVWNTTVWARRATGTCDTHSTSKCKHLKLLLSLWALWDL